MVTWSETDVVERQTSRRATHFERQEAQKVFRGSLDLDRFLIVEDPVMSIGGFARTTRTGVFMPPGSFNRSGIMPWLIHEFTHAWQYQHGVSIVTTAVEAIRARYDYGGREQLINDRRLGKRFTDYTTEQQADICSDFYELLISGGDVSAHQPYINEVRDPSLPAPPGRSPVLDLNNRLLLEAKLPLRRVESTLRANGCPADAAISLQTEAQDVRKTVDRTQERINKFPDGKESNAERKIITADVSGSAKLAELLERRMETSCGGERTTCIPVNPSVVVGALGANPTLGGLGDLPAANPQTFTQRSAASTTDLDGLREGDGLRFGSAETQARVRQLQEALNAAGASLAIDGMFGRSTSTALMDFQAQRGLPTRPFVDQVTAKLLAEPSPTQALVTSRTFQELRLNDGITWGTWERRPRVVALQERLTALGSSCKADGMFGRLTLATLNEFQISRKLPPNDEVDMLTADALQLEGRSPDPDQPRQCEEGEIPVTTSA